jgi:hypothetical protein
LPRSKVIPRQRSNIQIDTHEPLPSPPACTQLTITVALLRNIRLHANFMKTSRVGP